MKEESLNEVVNDEIDEGLNAVEKELNTPDLQQLCLTVCSMIMGEIQMANAKYPETFISTAEAQGVLARNYADVVRVIETMRQPAVDKDYVTMTAYLKKELCQLAAMCIKSVYSLTNLEEDADRFSEIIRQQQAAQELMSRAEVPEETAS